ncbi:Involved in the biosynthesis of the osmoprotectant glycine betaine. Catalyzes the reversible oxidation of betaine aldehyde to the corresponding acid [Vibrio sp. B1FIG11]|uniref:NAD-dependent succinate-semialdehyde dehydrogenase n=1 Tax=Vibrio sp. B1FIG11 TaxID=2751177 RepID=UPI001AF7A083|nr:NAD-dependent succinate-semialdehyde dehydrogenase [Vibrio sp. B1FIG11]CAD7814831.1 Involved in the biosynthesis of the osmoprotectant glycine betaine. Catalyzes the reversible oxidation of betaine aldehyde to the corresponding acid [Vibrio sp. B1FIG11]CAE6923452.1 Involved in the biosynthesis of the osmoprotectant glycine betaine. Catalyzes the reversible oxidation of betaine aldehyde to the corresponding acid [Vibrio sp. B1FIG11]
MMQQIESETLRVLFESLSSEDGIAVINPATEQELIRLKPSSLDELDVQIEACKSAQVEWAKLSAKARSASLKKWFQLLVEHTEDIANIITLEQGKPLTESRGEVAYGASFVEWFAEEAKRAYGEVIPAPAVDRRLSTIKQPVGVCAAITPWNFPIAMITRKAAPALAAGCGMIIKPSELTPLTALAVVELAHQAGIPKALLSTVVSEQAAEFGVVLSTDPRIKKISFTGSTRVGKILMKQASDTVKAASMELGGNAPFIVFDDADLDAAANGLIASKFRNAGQTCVCTNRLYVHQSVKEAFLAKLLDKAAGLTVGNGLEENTTLGPVITMASKHRLEAVIDQAVQEGATMLNQPQKRSGRFMEPIILDNVEQSMAIVQQELFGPVLPVISFDDDEQVLSMANDTEYGLACYFYTDSLKRIIKFSEGLEYGMVGVNEGIISTEVAPFGGIKESGIGREGAKQGMDEYLETKYICLGGLS